MRHLRQRPTWPLSLVPSSAGSFICTSNHTQSDHASCNSNCICDTPIHMVWEEDIHC